MVGQKEGETEGKQKKNGKIRNTNLSVEGAGDSRDYWL